MSSPNVGYATLQIIPSAQGFARLLADETDGPARRQGRRFGSLYAKSAFGPIRALGAAAAGVFAANKIGGFLKDAVAEASDLNEAGSKLKVVFGSATGQVNKFAETGAKALGQSKLAVQNAAATFGVYGKAAGLAGKANADFSTQLVSLSTDLASFYNTDPAAAAQAVAAGLRGEAEPLRAYGVLLDDATLRQEALRLGLIKTTKTALTPQQRVLAAQASIFRQTKDAQGDFARTSGGLANQQRILAAQVANLKGKLGSTLLPVVLGATKAMNGLFSGTGPLAPAFAKVTDAVRDFVSHLDFGALVDGARQVLANLWAIVTPLLIEAFHVAAGAVVLLVNAARKLAAFLVPLTGFLARHRTIVQAVAVAVLAGVLAYKAWTLAQRIAAAATRAFIAVQVALRAVMAANPIMLAVIALAALAAGLIYAYKHSERFRDIARKVFVAVGGFIGSFVGGAIRLFAKFVDFNLGVWEAILHAAAKALGWLPGGVGDAVKAADKAFASFRDATIDKMNAVAAAVGRLGAIIDNATRPRAVVIGIQMASGQTSLRAAERQLGIGNTPAAKKTTPTPTVKVPSYNFTPPASAIAAASTGAGDEAKKAAASAAKEAAKAWDQLGTFVRSKLLKGLTGTADAVRATFGRLRDAIVKAAKGANDETRKRLAATLATIKRGEAILVGIANKRSAVHALLEKAREDLHALQQEAAEFRANVAKSFVDLGNVAANGGEGGFEAIRKRMIDAIATANRFNRALNDLRAQGLNADSLRQLIEAGPEQGLAAANAILAGGAGAVAEVNALQAQLTKAATTVASSSTNALYQAGIDTAKGLVEGLQSQEAAIVAQMTRLAGALVTAVKKALGIASPSRVMRALGVYTMQGFVKGVDDLAPDAESALRAATAPPPPSVPNGGVAGSSAATARLVAPVYLDGRQVAEAVFEYGGRDYAAGRGNS